MRIDRTQTHIQRLQGSFGRRTVVLRPPACTSSATSDVVGFNPRHLQHLPHIISRVGLFQFVSNLSDLYFVCWSRRSFALLFISDRLPPRCFLSFRQPIYNAVFAQFSNTCLGWRFGPTAELVPPIRTMHLFLPCASITVIMTTITTIIIVCCPSSLVGTITHACVFIRPSRLGLRLSVNLMQVCKSPPFRVEADEEV